MSCSSCMPINPCGCKKKKSCDDCPIVDWVPNTACTIGVTVNGCTDTLELRPGIQNCETKTHMTQNQSTGCIEYQNELYVATDGQEGYIESICPLDIAKFMNLEDLANVEDEQPENCALLTYKTTNDCGPGCTGITDSWVHWYASEHLTNGLHWVAGFNENGCLEALDVPTITNKYWWGMWRPTNTGNGTKFGYIQPSTVSDLPTSGGNQMVLSQDSNGKPLYGPVKIDTSWSLCSKTEFFQVRNADSDLGSGTWRAWGTDDDFLVVPIGNTSWRAPCCGVIIVSYCVNIDNVSGTFEVDVTTYKNSQGTWTSDMENYNSTHSTWGGVTITVGSNVGVSESCTNFQKIAKGDTLRLHCRPISTSGTTTGTPGTGSGQSRYRVHAVKAIFIPMEKE